MRHGFHSPRFSRPVFLRGLRAALLAGSCLYGLCALAVWQSGSLVGMADGLRSLLGPPGEGNGDTGETQPVMALWLAVSLAVPLLLLLVFGLAALRRRVPLRVGLVRGFRAAALPAACGLLLVWGGLLLGTARQERAVDAQAWHTIHDEGPYLATQAGQSWPGPVR